MPGPKRVVLALDVGTSSCRASVYDTAGRRLRVRPAQASYQPLTTADGGAELDARKLLAEVRGVVDGILESRSRDEIVGVGTTTFWHSLLGLDARGEPLTPVYLWLDARSRDQAAWLRERVDQAAVHARVGCVIHWSYWPAKLLWLRQTQPEVFGHAKRWVSFGEYLLQQLTGSTGVSVSMASGTGLLNQHTLEWDAELLELLGVNPACLPPIIALDTVSSSTHWSKLRGARWLPAVGDGACSNLGAGCATPERFALMVGTSGAERVVWAPERLEIPRGTWCYRVDERRVVLGGALNDGGSLFDWLRRSLRLPPLRVAESELATLEPDGHGLTVLPFWGGERSPGWAHDAQGAVLGLRLHTRPIDVLRAALEAIALRFGELDRILLESLPSDQPLSSHLSPNSPVSQTAGQSQPGRSLQLDRSSEIDRSSQLDRSSEAERASQARGVARFGPSALPGGQSALGGQSLPGGQSHPGVQSAPGDQSARGSQSQPGDQSQPAGQSQPRGQSLPERSHSTSSARGREVVATGAALLHSPAWMQIMADVLGRPVLASAELQGSSRGVALLALETLGCLDTPLAEHKPEVTARYDPVPEHTERYRAAAERQRRMYDLLVRHD